MRGGGVGEGGLHIGNAVSPAGLADGVAGRAGTGLGEGTGRLPYPEHSGTGQANRGHQPRLVFMVVGTSVFCCCCCLKQDEEQEENGRKNGGRRRRELAFITPRPPTCFGSGVWAVMRGGCTRRRVRGALSISARQQRASVMPWRSIIHVRAGGRGRDGTAFRLYTLPLSSRSPHRPLSDVHVHPSARFLATG